MTRKPVCIGSFFKRTTYNKDHRHSWMGTKGFTTIDKNHKHKINTKKMIAEADGKDNHTHRLLCKSK